MKIHISHVLYSFGLGGLEGMIASLINSMDAALFSHSICVLHDDLASLKKLNARDVDVHVVKRHFRHDPSTVVRLARILGKLKPDIVRTYNWTGVEGILAAKLSGMKTIVHSEHGFDIEEACKKIRRRILIRKLLLRYCARIISVSKNLREWLIEDVGIAKGRVIYIPNGCDIIEYCPGRDIELRRRFNIGDNDTVIGTVGNLKAVKDQQSLLEAFGKVAMSRKDIKLMLVGEGPLRKDLEALAGKIGIKEKTIFAGSVPDTACFYRAMDIFTLPSVSENMPNVLLQAMATALPIIATDVGDVRHMLEDGRGGTIIKPKDSNALEKSIRDCLDHLDLAQARGRFARNTVERLFDINKIKDDYEKLYKSLVG